MVSVPPARCTLSLSLTRRKEDIGGGAAANGKWAYISHLSCLRVPSSKHEAARLSRDDLRFTHGAPSHELLLQRRHLHTGATPKGQKMPNNEAEKGRNQHETQGTNQISAAQASAGAARASNQNKLRRFPGGEGTGKGEGVFCVHWFTLEWRQALHSAALAQT